jgi:outer membrane lipoprotein LolB
VRRFAKVIALVALALATSACRTLTPPPSPVPAAPGSAAQAALALVTDWHARGRVGVRSPSNGWSAGFDWRESGGRGEVDVRGPLGAGSAHLTRTADSIRIDTGGEAIEIAAPFVSLDEELVARLGFSLPVDSLRYWLLGVPAPLAPFEPTAAGFRQAGWNVTLGAFALVAGSPGALPGRVTLARDATEIRVVINLWQVGAP